MSAKILLWDIECAPAVAHVWGLREQNIGLPQLRQDPRMMGFGAKWLGGKGIKWHSEYHHDRIAMLEAGRDLLDQADVVADYNGRTFDVPWLKGELAREGIEQPSPFKHIDLYRVVRKHFRFISYKLDYVAGALLDEHKVATGGHQLWVDCLEGDEETRRKAWAKMRRYCKQDVALLEPLFYRLQEFFPSNVNLAIFEEGPGPRCQKCGSDDLIAKGTAYTAQRAYPQYKCRQCGGWTRDSKASWSINTTGVS